MKSTALYFLARSKDAHPVSPLCVAFLGLMFLAGNWAEAQRKALTDSGPLTSAAPGPLRRTTGFGELADSLCGEWLFEPNSWFYSEPEETLTLPFPGVPMSVVQRPLIFERNDGQTAAEVAFLSRGRGYSIFLTSDEAVMVLKTPVTREGAERLGQRQPSAVFGLCDAEAKATEGWRSPEPFDDANPQEEFGPSRVLRTRLVGANSSPSIHGEKLLETKANYFIGNDPSRWRTKSPTFGNVRYQEVYPGIGLVYYGNEGRLEYDFVVAPGADPNQIAMEFEGADGLRIEEGGDLVLSVGSREVHWQKPRVYQEVNGERIEIAGRYRIRPALDRLTNPATAAHDTPSIKNTPSVQFVSFELAAYDRNLPLVIDPMLVYSTYLGGSGDDGADSVAVAVDGQGNVYVAGYTSSTDFPTRKALYGQNAGGPNDVFVAKFNPAGELLFSTYLGGSDSDAYIGIVDLAVTPAGQSFVVGATLSLDFPLTNAIQGWFGGGSRDGFVTSLASDGAALVFSTYLGGESADAALAVAAGPDGHIYVGGYTRSSDFPTLNAFQPALSGVSNGGTQWNDAFITRLGVGGTNIIYTTFDGQRETAELVKDIAVAPDGSAFAALWVQDLARGWNKWATAKFNPNGSRSFERQWPSTTTDGLSWPSIALASNDLVVLAGDSWRTILPAINAPSSGTTAGYGECYVALFNATNGAYRSAVYFGGRGNDGVSAITVDAAGDLVIAGGTSGPNFEPSGLPVTNPLESGPVPGLSSDVFVAKFHLPDLRLTFSTLFGGPGDESPGGMTLDARGNLWASGVVQLWRTNAQLPTLNAFQPEPGGGGDAFLVKLSLRDARVQISSSGQNVSLSWPAELTGFVLESSAALSAANWSAVPNAPSVVGEQNVVTVEVGSSPKFFRLKKP